MPNRIWVYIVCFDVSSPSYIGGKKVCYIINVVNKFKAKYKLNRVDGGINSEEDSTIRNLELRGSMAKRELK